MKGLFSILAVPALILPALANPVPVSKSKLETEATAILAKLTQNVAPMDAKIESTMTSLGGRAPNAAQLASLSGGMGGVIDALVEAVGELTTVLTAIDKRDATASAKSELRQQLTTAVTDISNMVAAVQGGGLAVNSKLGGKEMKTIEQMSAMGDPLGSVLPEAGEVINSIVLQIIGFAP